jgi:DNA-binding NarL/FixJ family response regulator
MAAGTQLHGHSRLDSLEQVVAEAQETGGKIYLLHDVLSSEAEDPGTQAARNLEWQSLMGSLSARERAVIECLVEGRSFRDAAKSFRVCDSTMQGDKRKLAVKIQDFMGVDILIEVRRSPRWKDDLLTSRERLACKHDRSH